MAKLETPLTRQRIVEAALRLIDQEGLEGFSMRKLGAMLGVEAMSLYNHVESKQALFDGVVELLITQEPYPDMSGVTPQEELWAFAHALRGVLRAHPRTLPLVAGSPLRTPATLDILDHLLETVRRTGNTSVEGIYVLQCLVGYVIGHTLIGTPPMADLEPGPNGPAIWRRFPEERYPSLHAVLPVIGQWSPEREFDFGLRALFNSMLGSESPDNKES